MNEFKFILKNLVEPELSKTTKKRAILEREVDVENINDDVTLNNTERRIYRDFVSKMKVFLINNLSTKYAKLF